MRYIGGVTADPSLHEARLRYAVGVENRQVLRVNRTQPEWAEDFGWTYNHAPNLAYWNGRFYLQYLSNPVNEHVAPGHTLIAVSGDGRNWDKPEVVFPAYEAPEGVDIPEGYHGYMMHQRMGFYTAPNGRLLTLAFYGHTEDPFREGGIGRVVREIYPDGSFGPIYFIRYSSYNNWNEANTSYPFYKRSADKGFVEACDSLLADKLKTLQWMDEDDGKEGDLYPSLKGYTDSVQALSYYHRKDGKVVALWKFSMTALSADEGATFSQPVKAPTLLMAGGKNWGQRTDDGRYAMSYNPIRTQEYRYPLIITTSDDGIIYDNMLLVHAEVPPRRFYGRWKDFGPNYMRGIAEGNGNPPGKDMYLAYSVNKEDIWISRIPVPVRYAVDGPVHDTFDRMEEGGVVTGWNIYAPKWAPAGIAAFPDRHDKSLLLTDKDPYDYARAIRVFQEGSRAELEMDVYPGQHNHGMLDIEVADRYGNRPVRIRFDDSGNLKARKGSEEVTLCTYQAEKWYTLRISVEASPYGGYDLWMDGKKLLQQAPLAESVKSVERLSLHTGPFRNKPGRETPNQQKAPPLPGADEPVPEAVFHIDNVRLKSR